MKTLAFDKAVSFRWYDEDGRMHVDRSNLTRVQVAPYRGAEIPDWKTLGLDPVKIYYGYRSAEELGDPETIKSVIGIPIQLNHHADTPDEPAMETRVGSTGDHAEFDGVYLSNSLHIQNEDACRRIRDGSMRELSLAYYYDPDFDSSGEFEGKHYDFTMRKIRGQHLALVEEGRAGKTCLVEDNALKTGEEAMPNDMQTPDKEVKPDAPQKEEVTELKVADAMSMLSDLLRSLHKQTEKPSEEEGEQSISNDGDKEGKISHICDSFAKLGADESAVAELRKSLEALAYEPETKEPDGDNTATDEEDKDVVDVDDEPIESEEGEKKEGEEKPAEGEGEKSDDLDDLARDALKACGLDGEDDDFKRAFSAGVHYGEKHEEAEKEEGVKPETENKESEEEVEGEEGESKIAQDAALQIEAKWDAIELCRPILGNVRRTAFDTAEDVFIAALKAVGFPMKNVTKDNAQAMLCGYLVGHNTLKRGTAADTATAEETTSSLSDVVKARVF